MAIALMSSHILALMSSLILAVISALANATSSSPQPSVIMQVIVLGVILVAFIVAINEGGNDDPWS